MGDFNNDGRDDLAIATDFGEGLGGSLVEVELSTGSGFIREFWGYPNAIFKPESRWLAGDFSGDGRDDLALSFNDAGHYNIEVQVAVPIGITNIGDTNPVTITGKVGNDRNGDGAITSDESGLENWTVFLDFNKNGKLDNGEQSTLTDGLGNYTFNGLQPGSYTVAVELPASEVDRWRSTLSQQNQNILVSQTDYNKYPGTSTISEYNSSGQLINSATIPYPGTYIPEYARDLIVDRDGNIQVYNGTFDPYLTTLSPDLQVLENRTAAGWSTANNLGGIAAYENYVFVSDMNTGGPGDEAKGIVRFDLDTGATRRYADTIEFIDLTVGLDGKLYGLDKWSKVYVFDPLTGANIKNFSIGSQTVGSTIYPTSSIAVNRAGEIYSVNLNSNVYKFSNNGALLNTITTPAANGYLDDINIAANGKLLITSSFGDVILADESMANPVTINTGNINGTFATFAVNDLFPSSTISQTVTLANGEISNPIDFSFQAINPLP